MTGLRTFHDTEPVAVTDKVRDVMLFTVPGLKDEEDDPIVAPDIPMRDDGAERIFVKAYIHDEIPWMDVSNEVRDLMFLAVPSINVPAEDLMFADAEIPLDDMDGSWFSEAETVTEAVTQQEEVPTTDADADVQPMVSAPSTAVAIAAPEVRIGIHAPAEVCMLTMPEPVMALAEPVPSVDTVPVETVVCPVTEVEIPVEAEPESTAVPEIQEEFVFPEPAETLVDDITVMEPPSAEAFDAPAEEPATITEDRPAVMFSFGSQEVRGSGWRVCFSF